MYIYIYNLSLFPVGVFGLLLGLQERVDDVPRAHESDPARHPQAGLVPEPCADLARGRHLAVRRRVRGAVLHHVGAVAAPDLLHLRLPVPRDDGARGDLRRSGHSLLLLPALQRGLPLVVAQFPGSRCLRFLHVPVCRVV